MYWKGKIQMSIKHLHTKQIRYGRVDSQVKFLYKKVEKNNS